MAVTFQQLTGIHHVSSVSANIKRSRDFYTRVLGMRPVIKTVNQDDTHMYHLFFGDGVGTPGSDMTVFDIPHAVKELRGNNAISLTSFRVSGEGTHENWVHRLNELGVANDASVSHSRARPHLASRVSAARSSRVWRARVPHSKRWRER